MLAAERGMTGVCVYLMSRGADVIAVDDLGTNSVHFEPRRAEADLLYPQIHIVE